MPNDVENTTTTTEQGTTLQPPAPPEAPPKEPAPPKEDKAPKKPPKDEKKPPEMFTKAQVEQMISERVGRELKKQQSEAERLASMTDEERKADADRKLQEEVAELRKQNNFFTMGREAAKIFAEGGITANDALLELVVTDTAEGTKEKVTAVMEAINAVAQEQVKKALAGQPPKKPANNGKVWTKAEIMAVKDTTERQKLIAENKHLFVKNKED